MFKLIPWSRVFSATAWKNYINTRPLIWEFEKELSSEMKENPLFNNSLKVFFCSRYKKLALKAKMIGQANKPVIVGPWMSEVGFEILYWIPFLKFMARTGKWNPNLVTALSRGGTSSWYSSIAGHEGNAFDLFSVDEYRRLNEERWRSTGGTQKQKSETEIEKKILEKYIHTKKVTDFHQVHPSMMYANLKLFWKGMLGLNWLELTTEYSPFPEIKNQFSLDLPSDFFAVKFYFNPSFPDTIENRKFCSSVIEKISQIKPVVLMCTNLQVDDHSEYRREPSDKVYVIDLSKWAARNLEVQSYIVSKSSGFYGTYGGFSYLPLFYNVSSTSFCSNPEKAIGLHLTAANHAALVLRTKYDCKNSWFHLFDVQEVTGNLQILKV